MKRIGLLIMIAVMLLALCGCTQSEAHAERIAKHAKKYIPEEMSFSASEYPRFEDPPTLEEMFGDEFPVQFVFREEEWSITEDFENGTHYSNDKNQTLFIGNDHIELRSGTGDAFHQSRVHYDLSGTPTMFHSEDYDYSAGLQQGWDEAGEDPIESAIISIAIYGDPRYDYELNENGELLSTWVTDKNGKTELRFMYDHTADSLRECDLRHNKFIGYYRGDGTLREVMYIHDTGRSKSSYIYKYDENFQFIEKAPAFEK